MVPGLKRCCTDFTGMDKSILYLYSLSHAVFALPTVLLKKLDKNPQVMGKKFVCIAHSIRAGVCARFTHQGARV